MTAKVGIIGSGVVGTAIGVILFRQGYGITGVCDLDPDSTVQLVRETGCPVFSHPGDVAVRADILFITANDGAISKVAESLAETGSFHNEQTVIHMSGAHSAAILAPARASGARLLSVHPLQSFASLEAAILNLPGSVFSIEGDKEAYDMAVELVQALGGEYFFIAGDAKPLYHAGACVVSNYLVTLIDLGARLLEAAGIPSRQAQKALMPLVRGTLNNIEKVGIPLALTGPLARGDITTVAKHLECMAAMAPDQADLYRLLGKYTVPIAAAKGNINGDTVRDFKKIFGPGQDMQS